MRPISYLSSFFDDEFSTEPCDGVDMMTKKMRHALNIPPGGY